MSDNIVEGDEMFGLTLSIKDNVTIETSLTRAIGTIVDSTTGQYYYAYIISYFRAPTGLKVRFTQRQYTGSEDSGFVLVTLELVGGTSSRPFNVTVTPLQQSVVSAEGNSVYDNVLIEECSTNR